MWTGVAIALVLAAYRLCVGLIEPLRRFFEPYTRLPIADALESTLFFILMVLLWTAYRRWVDALRHQTELERVISSISPDVLMVVSPERTIRMCNNGVQAMYGYEVAEVIGRTTDLLYYDRRTSGRPREIRDSLERFGFHVGFATGRRKSGQEFPLEIVTGDLKGEPGAVVMLRDITERRRTERQLIEAKEEAEAAHLAKADALAKLESNFQQLKELESLRDRLMHMIVHDLKSPLSTIHGYLQMLEAVAGAKLNADEQTYLKEATKLVSVLQQMIISLLDVSRLENRQMPLNLSAHDMTALAREALRRAGPDAGDRGPIRIEAPAEPVPVTCDGDIVTRVLVNLLDNALKFSPLDREVQLTVARSGGGARVTVTDRGPGIPPQHHERIFERFAQVEVRKYSTGLGLTFCKLAVEAHGGTIGVISEVGKGSTFWIEMPPGVPAAAAPAAG